MLFCTRLSEVKKCIFVSFLQFCSSMKPRNNLSPVKALSKTLCTMKHIHTRGTIIIVLVSKLQRYREQRTEASKSSLTCPLSQIDCSSSTLFLTKFFVSL
ncbi:hypothetical protein GOODEAATRI_015773 [Goodea atripinnis]|uniref:Uncharacterized protein n=1 Tax=Goodea atripinnis TaxID=208336 RepID=A0ABV0NW68_9TELE